MLSKEYFTMHLTPDGWKDGTEKTDNGTITERPVPEDTVLTLVFHEEVPAMMGKPDRWVDVEYKEPKDSLLLKQLFERYGKLPEGFENWKR